VLAVSLLALGALVVILAGACGGGPATATPRPEPTETPAAVVETQAPATTAWDRIKAAGIIRVGTSSGYPPFEYYAESGDLDGFDIGLMDAIGDQLGLVIQYKDWSEVAGRDPAEALLEALNNGEIDVAISHIVRTDERAQYMDFSQVYYTDRPAALMAESSNFQLAELKDLVKYKVAVQNGSIYETKMKAMLEEAGLFPLDYVRAYVDADGAVEALKAGEVDLALMHNQAALAYVEEGGVKEAGVAKDPLYLAIALPLGESALKAHIDDAIKALGNDGTIEDLSEEYMGTRELEPTPTAAPTTAPKPTSTPKPVQPGECSNRMELVKDTAVTNVQAGKPFTKVWQVKNTGTCTWDKNYKLVFQSGDKMNGAPLAVAAAVKPNATYEFKLQLTAPAAAGTYTGLWQMVDPKGTFFGEKLKVSIQVAPPPTLTPTPTPIPNANIEFKADPATIKPGQTSTLRWKVQHVDSYWVFPEWDAKNYKNWPQQGDTGDKVVKPGQTETWVLRALLSDDKSTVDTKQTITVLPPDPQAPVITRFTANSLNPSDPPGQIWLGEVVRIYWETEGQVDRVVLYANAEKIYQGTMTDGSWDHQPTAEGTVAYQLEVEGAGKVVPSNPVYIAVVKPALPPPSPTPTEEPQPPAPVIDFFDVQPRNLEKGGSVTISWRASGGTMSVRVVCNDSEIYAGSKLDHAIPNGPLDEARPYNYVLEATNAAGVTVSNGPIQVLVSEPAPPPPTDTPVPPPPTDTPVPPPPEFQLPGTNWIVGAMFDGGGNMIPLVQGREPTLFFLQNGRLEGNTGCRDYEADYQAGGGGLAILNLVPQGPECADQPDVAAQEQIFLDTLPMVASYEYEEGSGQLLLRGNTGQILMRLDPTQR
jgi:ABC-type amino acid transport substrate-binding protein/heat shock protein HslJ